MSGSKDKIRSFRQGMKFGGNIVESSLLLGQELMAGIHMQPKHQFHIPRVLARRGGKVGRPPKNIRPNFTPEQIEVAVQVVMYSKVIYNWVASEAEFLGVDLNTPEGHVFFKKNAREAALRLIK